MVLPSCRMGSPPRGRGKAIRPKISEGGVRITPAWAGKSLIEILSPCVYKDHPRVGGEKHFFSAPGCTFPGSPPRGRGKAAVTQQAVYTPGITPAWAGKSFHFGNIEKRVKDHPRVGGEKIPRWTMPDSKRGSPPRGRGKAGRTDGEYSLPRITPAWAGKSGKQSAQCCRAQDHPRVGGEKLYHGLSCGNADGITPAWAGKSPKAKRPGRAWGDHPRVGGEKTSVILPVNRCIGSPPRGRGKAEAVPDSPEGVRITPAWAGKR